MTTWTAGADHLPWAPAFPELDPEATSDEPSQTFQESQYTDTALVLEATK